MNSSFKIYLKERKKNEEYWTVSISKRLKNDYIKGFLKGLSASLQENVNRWGLVLVVDPAVNKRIEGLGTFKCKLGKGLQDSEAKNKGYQDGTSAGNTHKTKELKETA